VKFEAAPGATKPRLLNHHTEGFSYYIADDADEYIESLKDEIIRMKADAALKELPEWAAELELMLAENPEMEAISIARFEWDELISLLRGERASKELRS